MRKTVIILGLFFAIILNLTGCMDFEHYKNQIPIEQSEIKVGDKITKEIFDKIVKDYSITQVSTLKYGNDHKLYGFSQNLSNSFDFERVKEIPEEANDKYDLYFLNLLTYETDNDFKIEGEENPEKITNIELLLYNKGEGMSKTAKELLETDLENYVKNDSGEIDFTQKVTKEEIDTYNQIFSMALGVSIEYKEGMTVESYLRDLEKEMEEVYLNDKLKMFSYEPGFEPEVEFEVKSEDKSLKQIDPNKNQWINRNTTKDLDDIKRLNKNAILKDSLIWKEYKKFK